ncbi:MAG: hypothetical protein IT463_14305, partial [Planctomycetes bacterium]|nr:hypothetical protein [Planctomycetota bacterium]
MRFVALVLLLLAPALSAQQPRAARDFLKHAFEAEAPLPRRMAALQQAERAGGIAYDDLAAGMDDADPGFRVALLRLLARLKLPEAGSDVLSRLGNRSVEAQERAWLARAAANTAAPEKAVPALVDLLPGSDGQERLAALESLSRLTGVGRAPVRLLGIGSEPEGDAVAFWRQWWNEHQHETPAQWQLAALGSRQPRDRGAAARALADAGRRDAVPALLARLRAEDASGVREALARALSRLTGRRVPYQAWAGDDVATWQTQHDAAVKAWQDWWDAGGAEPRTLAQQLSAPEAASRAEALRAVAADAGDAAIGLCIEALADPAAGVRVAAWNALARLLGFAWPFEAGGAPELRDRQLVRWRAWWAVAREQTPGARLLAVVVEPAFAPPGWNDADTGVTEAAEGAMGRRAAALRRLVAMGDTAAGEAVLPMFERGVGELERGHDVADFPGNVQLQMAWLLGRTRPKGAVTILRARLGLKADT